MVHASTRCSQRRRAPPQRGKKASRRLCTYLVSARRHFCMKYGLTQPNSRLRRRPRRSLPRKEEIPRPRRRTTLQAGARAAARPTARVWNTPGAARNGGAYAFSPAGAAVSMGASAYVYHPRSTPWGLARWSTAPGHSFALREVVSTGGSADRDDVRTVICPPAP